MANEDPNGELGVLLNGELHIVTGIASVSFKFLQHMLALRRNSRLTESAYTDLKKFQVDTNGEYTIFNIPSQNPEKIGAFKQQLKNAAVALTANRDNVSVRATEYYGWMSVLLMLETMSVKQPLRTWES